MTATALLLAALAAGPALNGPTSAAPIPPPAVADHPAPVLPSPYEACVSWVETLNGCNGGAVDPYEGCAFAERIEDKTTAALYTCWTQAVQASSCDMESTGQCEVLTAPVTEDAEAAVRARQRDRALNWCTRAVERVDRCGRHHGLIRTEDLPVYRCKAEVDAGRMTYERARRLYRRVRRMNCRNKGLVRRAMVSRSVPPPIDRGRCVSACKRYYYRYNRCADAAGWSTVSWAEVTATCDVADTCGEYDYARYYKCLSEALPDRCEDAESPLANVYQCRLE